MSLAGFFSFHWLGPVSTAILVVASIFRVGGNTVLVEAAKAGQVVGDLVEKKTGL